MGHYSISASFDRREKGIDKLISILEESAPAAFRIDFQTGMICVDVFHGNADRFAAKLSSHPAVDRVVAVHVAETSIGVWRKGKRS